MKPFAREIRGDFGSQRVLTSWLSGFFAVKLWGSTRDFVGIAVDCFDDL